MLILKNSKSYREMIFLILSLVISILALSSLIAVALSADSTTRTVHPTDPGADFTTIQSAIDNSSPGDSVEVWNGTYNENVIVNKQLTLYSRDGANVTIIDAQSKGNAITVVADGCIVDGLKTTGAGTTKNPGAGIHVESNGNTIKNCISENNDNSSNGISLLYSSKNTLSNNTFAKNNLNGIYIWFSSDNTILNNDIFDNEDAGINLTASSGNVIYFNNFLNNSRGDVNSYSSDNLWNSSSEIIYTYNGSQHTNYIGNHWSNYLEADKNSDGTGDIPYTINEGETGSTMDYDHHPLIKPFKYYSIVANNPPVVNFTFSPASPLANEIITFNATPSYDPDGFIVSYLWDFGDGKITAAENITEHHYTLPGDYTVTLTVTDDADNKNTTSEVITVQSPLIFPVHNLNTSESFSTIQEAIYAGKTKDGDIIEIDTGIYYETVKVNKSLTIRSISKDPSYTIVSALKQSDHVFEIIADYVNISRFTITGATENGKAGIFLNEVDHCNIADNIISESHYGIYFINSTSNTVTGNTFYNGTLWDLYLINSGGNTFDRNILSDLPTEITFTYAGDIALGGVSAQPPDLSGYKNISKYVNATNATDSSWFFLNIFYTDTDLGSLNESTLRMYGYNGTGWELVPGTNGVNMTENYVYANITSHSIFAPMGQNSDPGVLFPISGSFEPKKESTAGHGWRYIPSPTPASTPSPTSSLTPAVTPTATSGPAELPPTPKPAKTPAQAPDVTPPKLAFPIGAPIAVVIIIAVALLRRKM